MEYAARLLTQTHLHSAPMIQSELLGIVSITDILERSNAIEQPQEVLIADQIRDLSEQARHVCREHGPASKACLNAWLAVDVLQAEAARQRAESLEQTASEQYYDEEFPEAFKDREYEAWCSG